MSRRLSILAAAIAAVVLLAGCAGLPTSSGVQAGQAIDNHTVPTVGNIEYPGPVPGADQKAIVGGFLDATAGSNQNYERAREYLTKAADAAWEPRTVQVVSGSRDPVLISAGEVSVTIKSVAVLDATGHLTEQPTGSTSEAQFGLTQVHGQWRISELPKDFGLWMNLEQFQRNYQPQEIYYAAATAHTLVPDTQWYSQTGLVSSLAAAVIRGAPSWMDGMTMPDLPKGSELTGPSVSIDNNGVASVNVSEQVLSATPAQRTALWASMLATLGQVSEVRRVELLVDGARLQSSGLPDNPEAPSDVGYSAISGNPSSLVARTSATAMKWMDVGESGADSLRNPSRTKNRPTLPTINHNWHRLAISADGEQVVAIDGTDAVLGRWVRGRLTKISGFGSQLTTPSFSVTRTSSGELLGELWVAGQSTAKDSGTAASGTVWVIDTGLPVADAQPQPIEATWLRTLRIRAIRVSPDGERIAIVARTRSGGSRVYVAGIMRDKKGHAQELTPPLRVAPNITGVLDVGWSDYTTLAVLSDDDGSIQPYDVPIGGVSSALGQTPGGTNLVTTGTGANSLYVETDANTVLTRVGASWQKVPGVIGVIASGA